ncbi:MAG: hypothetical protein AAF708_03150 [Deinococcota bacterium]
MSDETKQYTAREIVLDLFPATQHNLVPKAQPYSFERDHQGNLVIVDANSEILAKLTPITSHGANTTQMCCDLCKRSAPRHYLQMFRLEAPGSNGRVFRYLSVCKNDHDCAVGYMDSDHVRMLVETVLELA